TPLQLAAQHGKCPPMLDSLFPQDRPAIARALSKAPEQRFPTCGEMVQNLLNAAVVQHSKKGTGPPRTAGAAGTPPPVRAEPTRRVVDKTPEPVADLDSDFGQTSVIRAQPSPSRVRARLPKASPVAQTDESLSAPKEGTISLKEAAEGGQLRPTLFLGVGGIAGWTLQRLRHQIFHRFRHTA